MNWVDILILLIVGLNVLTGLRRGLIRSVFGLIAILLAIFMSVKGLPISIEIIKNYFKFPLPVANVFGFSIIFCSVYFFLTIVGNTVHELIKTSFFAPANYLGGALLGLIKGIVLILFLILPILNSKVLFPVLEKSLNGSLMLALGAPLIETYSPMVQGVIDESSSLIKNKKEDNLAKLRSYTEEKPKEWLNDPDTKETLSDNIKKEVVKYIVRKTISEDVDF